MVHSLSSVHSLAVVKHSVRSKTSRFTPESTRTGGPSHVHKAAVKASEQEGICVTTSVATLGIGPLNAPFAAPTTTARMYLRPTWSSVSSLHSARCNFSASNPKRSSLLIQRRRYRSQWLNCRESVKKLINLRRFSPQINRLFLRLIKAQINLRCRHASTYSRKGLLRMSLKHRPLVWTRACSNNLSSCNR